MGLSKFFLNTGEALRPVLTKIIPMKLLSKMKAGIINNATDKLSADSIEKYEAGRYKCGANIIGNIKGDNGLGQSARIIVGLCMAVVFSVIGTVKKKQHDSEFMNISAESDNKIKAIEADINDDKNFISGTENVVRQFCEEYEIT